MDGGSHVLVVGAGYVGLPAAGLLAARGHRVTAVRRSRPEDVPPGVDLLALDLDQPGAMRELPPDADVVICCLSPGRRDPERYRWVHVEVPAAVVGHLSAPPRRVLLTTSTAVYAQQDGSLVTEESPARPQSPTARAMLEGEDALPGLAPSTVALRLGGIYGPGRTSLLDQVLAGTATCVDGAWTNRIHRDDAAAALAHLAVSAPPGATVCNVVDDTPSPHCEVVGWLAEQLDAPAPTPVAPDDPAARLRGGSKRVDNARLRSLGWAPRFPSYRDGYREVLRSR